MSKIKFGVMNLYSGNVEESFQKAYDLGLDSFIYYITPTDDKMPELMAATDEIKRCSEKYGVEISAIWSMWGMPCSWSFVEGPNTLGLVPVEYRDRRLKIMMNASDFAQKIGVADIITHAGYIPENPNDPVYTSFIALMKHLAGAYKARGQYFIFETGQETPVTLLRTIEDIGAGNLGVNLDTANLIIYGKGNPCDAMVLLGDYIRCTHLKDGTWPKNGRTVGTGCRMGEGAVNFPEVIRLLHQYGYKGHFSIEREISGEQQIREIREASVYIRELCSRYDWE